MSISTEGLLSLKSHTYSIQLAISHKAAMVFDTGIVPREEASYHVRGIIDYIHIIYGGIHYKSKHLTAKQTC